MTLVLTAGFAACFAQTDSLVRQYVLPTPRITHETKKQEPKTPSEALRELVNEPKEAGILPIPLTLEVLSSVLHNFERNGSPLVRDLVKESRDGLDVFVLTDKGNYKYDPEKRKLNLQAAGDFRTRIVGENKEWSDAKCFILATVKSMKAQNLSRELRRAPIETEEDEGPDGNASTLESTRTEASLAAEFAETPNNDKKTERIKENLPVPTDLNLPKYVVLLVANEYDFDTK